MIHQSLQWMQKKISRRISKINSYRFICLSAASYVAMKQYIKQTHRQQSCGCRTCGGRLQGITRPDGEKIAAIVKPVRKEFCLLSYQLNSSSVCVSMDAVCLNKALNYVVVRLLARINRHLYIYL